jgi:Na+/proline symporter
VTFTENIWRQFRPRPATAKTAHHAHQRAGVRRCVLTYSIKMEGTPIYELVSSAYQVPLVGAFVPLVFGLYWKRATTQGAIAPWRWALACGCCSWWCRAGRTYSRSSWQACWRP